jgi:hypothetical protein
MKIFIQIASYRDPELKKTIKSAIENAKKPNNLIFGIARQFHPEDGFDNLDEYRKDKRFRILDIPYFYLFNEENHPINNLFTDNVIVVSSFSKSLGLSGFRVGFDVVVSLADNSKYKSVLSKEDVKYTIIGNWYIAAW